MAKMHFGTLKINQDNPEVTSTSANDLLKDTELRIMIKVSDLQRKSRQQKFINYVLGTSLLITILLHLI